MSKKFKRLFFDIETSPNLVFSWNVGYDIKIDYDNIIKERAIICICYKYEGEDKVHSLSWDKGDDKKMLQRFVEIINCADEVIGHNSDRFDVKWVRTRCIYHGIHMDHSIKSIDTLKEARGKFKFNSNKLDYIGRYLGMGKKMETGGFSLWKDVVLNNSSKALKKMVDYCKQDVILLESIFKRINPYIPAKTNAAIMLDRDIIHCPECLSSNTVINKHKISAAGAKTLGMQCKSCGKYFTVAESKYDTAVRKREELKYKDVIK
jgi:DNA polymerase elongation subunit (family B)